MTIFMNEKHEETKLTRFIDSYWQYDIFIYWMI
jgi:hypothetical protein